MWKARIRKPQIFPALPIMRHIAAVIWKDTAQDLLIVPILTAAARLPPPELPLTAVTAPTATARLPLVRLILTRRTAKRITR